MAAHSSRGVESAFSLLVLIAYFSDGACPSLKALRLLSHWASRRSGFFICPAISECWPPCVLAILSSGHLAFSQARVEAAMSQGSPAIRSETMLPSVYLA